MSRDRGFPLAKLYVLVSAGRRPLSLPDRPLDDSFGRVNKTLRVPIWALALQTIVPIILSFIYLGSDIIFYAFFQVTILSLLVATCVPC